MPTSGNSAIRGTYFSCAEFQYRVLYGKTDKNPCFAIAQKLIKKLINALSLALDYSDRSKLMHCPKYSSKVARSVSLAVMLLASSEFDKNQL